MQQLAAREDVLLDKVTHARAQLRVVRAPRSDAVVQHQPAGAQQAKHGIKVAPHLRAAHMLEHADRRDLVKAPVGLQLAIVLQLNPHTALQTAFMDQPLHMRVLVA